MKTALIYISVGILFILFGIVSNKKTKAKDARCVAPATGRVVRVDVDLEEGVTYYVKLPKAICEGQTSKGRNDVKVIAINQDPTGISSATAKSSHMKAMKIMENGRIVIRKEGKDYDFKGISLK